MVIWGWKWRKAHRQSVSACDAAICFWHVLEGNTCVNAEIQLEVGLRYGKQATNQSSKNNGITICKWPSRQSQSLKDIYSLFRPIALGDEPPSWLTYFQRSGILVSPVMPLQPSERYPWLHRRVECIKISPCKSCKSCFAGI